MSREPTVFIVEDDGMVSASLLLLFESIKLKVEIFPDGPSYLKKHNSRRRGCLIIDIRLPGMSGLELQKQLNALNSPIPIIFISGHAHISMAVHAIKAGAFDFVTKPFQNQALIEIVQNAITQSIQHTEVTPPREINARFKLLTQREREVMRLVTAGKLNKQIADELGISSSTVEVHRSHVMQKMQTRSLAILVKMSLQLTQENVQ